MQLLKKNPYSPQGRSAETPRGTGVLEAKYELKLIFPGEGGAKQKPSVGGVRIFSGTAQYELLPFMVHAQPDDYQTSQQSEAFGVKFRQTST